MLESIVLLWIAVQLQAPMWVYAIVILMLLSSTLSFIVDIIDKVEKKRLKRAEQKRDELLERYGGKKEDE